MSRRKRLTRNKPGWVWAKDKRASRPVEQTQPVRRPGVPEMTADRNCRHQSSLSITPTSIVSSTRTDMRCAFCLGADKDAALSQLPPPFSKKTETNKTAQQTTPNLCWQLFSALPSESLWTRGIRRITSGTAGTTGPGASPFHECANWRQLGACAHQLPSAIVVLVDDPNRSLSTMPAWRNWQTR